MSKCARCDGNAREAAIRLVPFIDGQSGHATAENIGLMADRSRECDAPETCTFCNGYGVRSQRTYQAYKSAAMADKYRGTRSAMRCDFCRGIGRTVRVPILEECYACRGRGWCPDYRSGEPIHADACLTENASDEFVKAWLRDSTVQVIRRDGGQSWVEHNIGLGLWSCTDYGRMWSEDDPTVALSIMRELHESNPQLCKLAPRETRIPGRLIVVALNRNGYSLLVHGAPVIGGVLPPTYTTDVLFAEM